MKVQLAEERTIRGREYAVGEIANVPKKEGQRMIDDGIAVEIEDRVIGPTENRVRFANHTRFGRK